MPLLFLASNAFSYSTEIAYASEDIEISVISKEDAFVAGGENADLNYGAANPITIRKHSTSAKNDSQGYIKFSIPSGVESVSKAIFDLGLQSPTPTTKNNTFTIYTTDNDWEEGNGKIAGAPVDYNVNPKYITYNNVPDIYPNNQTPVVFNTTAGVVRDERYSVDVTQLVNNYISTFENYDIANEITLCISSTVDKGESTSFQSSGYEGKEPKLTLTLGEFDDKHNIEEIYDGLTYTTERVLNSSKTPVNMFSMEVSSDSSLTFYTGLPEDKVPLEIGKRATATEMAEAAEQNGKKVVAGINSDFFNASNDNAIQPRGLVIRDGTEYHLEYNGAMFFGVLKNGDPIIGGRNEYYANKGNLEMAVGGDIGYLVKDGIPCATNDEAGEHGQNVVNPRTAIGIKADKSVVMTVCDGRTSDSNGMVLTDLAKYMVSKGCITAINLDGGWSSTMIKKDFENDEFDVCNYPSNNGIQRPLGETILVIDTDNTTSDPTIKEKVSEFVTNYMHMNDIDKEDNGTGLCYGVIGYYSIAKTALLALEQQYPGAISIFSTDSDFVDAYERMQAWASANGEVFNEYGFKTKNTIIILKNTDITIILVSITALMIAIGVGTLIYIKKKRTN